jgi:hypothetical protein
MKSSLTIISPQERQEPLLPLEYPLIYPPNSLRDLEKILHWLSLGYASDDLVREMAHRHWRTDFSILKYQGREHLFCAVCEQFLTMDHCIECGQTLPVVVPLLSEIEMYFYQKELARHGAARSRKWGK